MRLLPLRQLLLFLFLLPLLMSCESRKTIVNGLDEKEANEILVFLNTRNIDAIKIQSAEGGGAGAQQITLWDISVPAAESTKALAMLNQSGLPRRRGQSLLNIFSNVGLVPSEMEQRIRYQAGLAEQIASFIRKIDGILDAEVLISFPEEDPLNPGKTRGPITASVYVKHSGVLDDPNLHLVSRIKRLVTASVTGLDLDNVTVVGDRARFGDLPLELQRISEEEHELTSVWNIVIAKESLTRFRLLFFSLLLIVLILIITVIWIGWKVYPLLEKGGFAQLFHLKPIEKKAESAEEEPAKEDESEEEVEEKEPEEEEKKGPPDEVT